MILKLYKDNNSASDLDHVAEVLRDGGLIIYPTDTAYAAGCDGTRQKAVERLCRLKGVDERRHHFSIICHDFSQISEYARVDNPTFKLMKRNLPGPFTFILPPSSTLPRIFRKRREVGIRIPDNNIIRDICRHSGVPVVSTTLPLEEGEDYEYLTNPELIDEKFGDLVDLVIDGGNGRLDSSTIVDCTGGAPEITRRGAGILKL